MRILVIFSVLVFIVIGRSSHAAQSHSFTSIGFCCTGFGVPGTGAPLILGKTALIAPGEGFLTVCDVKDASAPRVVRYIPSWYFTYSLFPVPSRNLMYMSNSRGPLLVINNANDLGNRGEIKTSAWNSKWGRSFIAGIASDGIGYAGIGDTILVIDFNDPRHLKEAARIVQPRFKPAQGSLMISLMAFSKDFHFSAEVLDSGEHIGLFRWKNRAEPVQCSEIYNKDPGMKTGTCAYGSLAGLDERWLVVGHSVYRAIIGQCTELSFWDISNISRPRLKCEKVFYAAGTVIRGMALSGHYCYVIDGRERPGQHTVLPSQHSRLYVLDLDSLEYGNVPSRLDSSTPSPKTIAMFEDTVPGEYSGVTINGKNLYINDYDYGLRIFDISDPQAPKNLGGVPTAAEGHWLYVSGDYAYMSHTFGGTLHVISVKDQMHPKTVGYYWDGHWLNYKSKIRGRGNAMYLPEGDRVAIVDISDPASPKSAGEAYGWGNQHIVSPCMDIIDEILFVVEGPHAKSPGQLLTFDITDPLKPVLLCTFDLPDKNGFHLVAAGKMVYCVAYGGKHLLAIDVSDPKFPRITADFAAPEINVEGKAFSFTIRDMGGNGSPGMAFSRGYLYVVTGGSAPAEPYLIIFDVRDQKVIKPVKVFFASDRGGWQYFSCDVLASGNRLYVEDYGSENAYDISNRLDPKAIARYSRAYAWQLGVLRDSLLYVPKLDGLEIMKVPALQ